MNEIVIDLQTGEAVERELTEAEITAKEARAATGGALPPSLAEQLDAIFLAQPVGLQIMFSGPMALVERYLLRGQTAEAKTVIENTPIPVEVADAAEPVRQQMLDLFN